MPLSQRNMTTVQRRLISTIMLKNPWPNWKVTPIGFIPRNLFQAHIRTVTISLFRTQCSWKIFSLARKVETHRHVSDSSSNKSWYFHLRSAKIQLNLETQHRSIIEAREENKILKQNKEADSLERCPSKSSKRKRRSPWEKMSGKWLLSSFNKIEIRRKMSPKYVIVNFYICNIELKLKIIISMLKRKRRIQKYISALKKKKRGISA